MFCNKIKKIKAFTLSEVLTTLMVVGIVAAMTIPTLNTNVEQQKRITMLKKLYSSYTVNIKAMLSSEGTLCDTIACTRKWGIIYPNNDPRARFNAPHHNGALANTSYFEVENECIGNCLDDYFNGNTDVLGARIQYTAATHTLFASLYELKNSAATIIYDYNNNCTEPINNNFRACSIIIFDTNGSKGPNSPCADRYAFYLANDVYNAGNNIPPNYLVPLGYQKLNGVNNMDSVYDCTAQILSNGWKR